MSAPTQQRTCLWPSVVTQRRQAFWQSFGRWFVRPFRQLTPVALIRRASSQGRPGAMTPKIARFLAAAAAGHAVPGARRGPRGSRISARCRRVLPLARIYYAVKANPAPPVLERLVGLDSSLRCREHRGGGRVPGRRRASARRSASATRSRRCRRSGARMPRGVTLFAFDSAEELEKLARSTRPARGSIAASWWRTRAPTGRCRASSAPRSRTPGS